MAVLDQFNILVESAKMALELADFSGLALVKEDAAFHRFFVRNRLAPVGGRWTSERYNVAYAALHHNLLIPQRFPITRAGSGKRRTRVTYSCVDPHDAIPRNGGCAAGMEAYTVKSDFTQTGSMTVFCPGFFARGHYLNDIIRGPRKSIGDFGGWDLISYEQMIVHEWMHSEAFGYRLFIDDLYDTLSTKDPTVYPIYGMSRCKVFAWKFMNDECCKHVNLDTIRNADNYAWYFSNKYYAKVWGWTDDGSRALNYTFDPNVIDYLGTPQAATGNVSSADALVWPANCTTSDGTIDALDSVITCIFGPPAPDDAVAIDIPSTSTVIAATSTTTSVVPTFTRPLTGPCNCDENSCTDDSPVCCANGTCS